MRLARYLCLTTCLLALTAFDVQAQSAAAEKELGTLKGYNAPKMFSGPSAAPLVTPAAPAAAQPSPASPPKQPASSTTVSQPAEPATILPVPQTPAAAVPKALPQINAPVTAEQLLNFPSTGTAETIAPKPVNPAAVPAAPVETGLPLPGSVPPSPKKSDPVKETKKSEPSKTAPKKAEIKKDEVKKPEVKKTELQKPAATPPAKKEAEKLTVKQAPKPAQKPIAEKPVPAKKADIQPSVKKAAKPDTAIVKKQSSSADLPLPVPDDYDPFNKPKSKPEPVADLPKPKEMTPYRLDGKKNMPSIKQAKIEKEDLTTKSPLPELNDKAPIVAPTRNEKIIDQALEKNLLEPTTKAIEKQTAPLAPDKKTPKPSQAETVSAPVPKPVTPPVAAAPAAVKPVLISMEFKSSVSDLQTDQKKIIDTDVLPKLKADTAGRLQILSYAAPAKEGQSSARRLSLSRGLALREYFLQKGIQPNRIDIRALGDSTQEKPLDRADLLFIPSK